MASADFVDVIEEELAAKHSVLRHTSLQIWTNPEIAYKEFKAHDLLCDVLEDGGFQVTRRYILPTGFKAEWSNGAPKPRIAFLCEYDALPEIGHACGHNLIAEAGLAMAFMTKRALQGSESIRGTVVVLGTPAEEGGGGKIEMLEAFKDVDAAFIIHPLGGGENVLNGVTLCSSRFRGIFRSEVDCERSPHVSRDLNMRTMALLSSMDAAVIAYGHLSLLRKTIPHTWRICVVLKPLMSNKETQLHISYRSVKGKDMKPLREKIVTCLEAAAKATQCDFEYTYTKEYLDQWPNHTMTSRVAEYCDVFAFERENARKGKRVETFLQGSSDVGNISQILPLIQVFPCVDGLVNVHEQEFTDISKTAAAEEPILEVAKACARTAIDLFADPKILKDAWKELRERQLLENTNSK